jgi:Tol biopolymer transport system component/predicted Ser/Thr protein kinase
MFTWTTIKIRWEMELAWAEAEMSSDQWSIADNPGRKALAPGTLIGAYRIEAPLGEGGMGTVYRALDTKLNRPVAIKFLSDDLADAAARRRFQRGAQMASSLNHPHILTVYDVGEFEGRQYIVTEFVDGGTLKDWARQEKRTWKQIVELLTGVADGLAAAHTAGILHRDIKPANILVAKNGYAKLADFGLAKLAKAPPEGDATQTLTGDHNTRIGAIVGTIAYMSPEQASGRPLDARSDISSFGVVLYELLAGRRPFSGSSELEILQTIIHGTPEPLGPDVPFVLGLIVGKALDKDPADRYQSARELVVDLRRLARQKVAEPVPPVVVAQPGRSYWILAAAVLLLGVGGVTGWLAKRPPAAEANPLANARFTRLTDFEGVERDAAISPDGRFVAFLSNRSGPFDIWVTQVGTGSAVNLTQGKTGNLDGLVGALGFSGDGSQVWFHDADVTSPLRILPLMGGAPRVFLASSPVKEPPYNAAWSPDGNRLVYFTADGGDPMFVTDRTGASPHQILRDKPGIHNHYPIWSRDGQWIYFVRGSVTTSQMDLWRISPNRGEPERLTQHNSQVSSPAPLDLRTVVYVARDRDGSGPWLWALDVNTKTTRRISFGLEKYVSVSASADGRHLVATEASPIPSLWSVPILNRVAEERDAKPYPVDTVRALGPRFGGTSLFYLSSRGTGDGLWRFQDGQSTEIWKGSDGALLDPPAVSADGQRVAITLRRSGKLTLHVATAEGSELRPLGESIDISGAADWSRDGQWIVTGGTDGHSPGIFKIPVNGGIPVRVAEGLASNPVWSPAGNLIAYAGENVGFYAPLLAVRPDGTPVKLPSIEVLREGVRVRFLPDGSGLIYMQGPPSAQNLWLLDLTTMKTRELTRLDNAGAIRSFDISPDGNIVFDRLRGNSHVVLIDLPGDPGRL